MIVTVWIHPVTRPQRYLQTTLVMPRQPEHDRGTLNADEVFSRNRIRSTCTV